MSLKAFHLVFVTASALLAFGLGFWLYDSYRSEGDSQKLWLCVLACASGVALVVYEWLVIKKFKHISYL
jgi:H+/Cl- antiporter ClcA